MNTVIRDADGGDVAALSALVDEVQKLHVASRPELFKPTQREEFEAWFRQLLQNPSVKVWVAVVAGVVRGYVVIALREQALGPFNFRRTWLELDQIGVQSGYRRQGLARALVAAARAYAAAQGNCGVELTSWSFNQDAHRAFAKLGFVPKVVRFELTAAADF